MKLQRLLSLTRQALDKYNLIEDGDRIAVGVSGGKDSLALLYALHHLQRFYPRKYELCAITVDLGLGNMELGPVRELCREFGVPYTVIPTEIGKVLFDIRKESNPCSLCAKMRRGALNELAKEVGCNKVALGHHRDDALETLLLCLLHEGRIHTFHPKSYLSRMDLTVIRPMVYVPEKHVIHVARELNLPVVASSCPANGNTQREEMKALLDRLCKTYPNARELMLSALQNEDQYGLWNRPHKP